MHRVVLVAMFDISIASEGSVAEQVYNPDPTFSQYFHSFLYFIRIFFESDLFSVEAKTYCLIYQFVDPPRIPGP